MKGLFDKYKIEKVDGTPIDENAVYFVLRLDTDPAARMAAWEYAEVCESAELTRALKKLVANLRSELGVVF